MVTRPATPRSSRGNAAPSGAVFPSVRRAGTQRGESRLLAYIAEELERHLGRDGGIQAASAALQRLGVSVVVSVVAAPGGAAPRVTTPESEPGVPQWSEEDAEILRSMGIARDDNPTHDGPPSEPGRRHPR